MASFLDPQNKLHLDVSVIDCEWYYGCLFSPNKYVGIHPSLLGGVEKNHNDDGHESHPQFAMDDRDQHSRAKKNGRYEQSLRQEGKKSTVPCFGTIAFDPNKFCKEDAEKEADCVDNHNDDGNESDPQVAMDDKGQHSSGRKNGRYEECLRQESNKNIVPCFGPSHFDPKKLCEEDADEETDCVNNRHNDDGNESHPQFAIGDRGQHSRAQKNGRYEQSLRQEGNKSTIPCFGPTAFDPKKLCKEDTVEEAECVDNHNSDGNESHPQFAMDERGQHSRAQTNGRYEESLRQESNKSTFPCFEPTAFDPKNFCKEYADEEAECVASIFRVLDEDGDGRVSVDEIMSFLGRLSLEMPREEVKLAVRSVYPKGKLDSDEKSSLCGDEFLTAMEFAEFYRFVFSEQEEVDPVKAEEDATSEAFGMFDQNGDGFISAMELADVLSRLGFVEGKDVRCCESMIESVDCNGDGFVDIHEFRHLITRTTYPLHPELYCLSATNKA